MMIKIAAIEAAIFKPSKEPIIVASIGLIRFIVSPPTFSSSPSSSDLADLSSLGIPPIVTGTPVSGTRIFDNTKQAGIAIIEAETKCPKIFGKTGRKKLT